MKKALALCGGGSKGSYQMGVWKALNELGEKIDIVCGTSIGALNASMIAQDKYDECLDLWKKTRNDTILATPISIDENSLKKSFKNMKDLVPFLKNYLKDKGADITPFKKSIDYYIDEEKIINSPLDIGVVCVTFPGFKPHFVRLKEVKKEDIKSYILASASCFPLFPLCKIGNTNYIDGGYFDNLPIDFCLDLGAHEVIAVDLNFNITHKEYLNKPFIKYIYPSHDLGGFFNFDKDLIENNMILGYNDAMKKYGKYLGFRYTFYKEEDLSFIAQKFMIILANIFKDFRKAKIRSLYKEEINLYDILEKYTYRPLSYIEYYIRAVEELMEYLKFDYLQVYRLKDISFLLLKKVLEIKSNNIVFKENYDKQKTSLKKRDYLNKSKAEEILSYSFHTLNAGKILPSDFVLDVLAVNPYLVIYMILEMTWSDFDAEEEKNFGFTFEFTD